MSANRYKLIKDFAVKQDTGYLTSDPYWILTVVRLAYPLSFSRKKMASVVDNPIKSGALRASKPLIITDDCISVSTSGSKRGHTKGLSATLKETSVNYLTEILPGDWVFCNIVNNKEKYQELLGRIYRGKSINRFNDGFKFVGRVQSIRKSLDVDPSSGTKSVSYSVQATGFKELDMAFYYDWSLASVDMQQKQLGTWLTRLSIDLQELFATEANGIKLDNINRINRTLINMVLGKGPGKDAAIKVSTGELTRALTALPQVNEAPYTMVVPAMVGQLLGKEPNEFSDDRSVMSYADLLELLQGVQEYSPPDSKDSPQSYFTPRLDAASNSHRKLTPHPMMGTFLPHPPTLINRPLWGVLQQYINPTINEMYTAFRVNDWGDVVPTIVFRQIPFTTNALDVDSLNKSGSGSDAKVTRFLDLPRWIIPTTAIQGVEIGRSDATRFNLIHVYGQASTLTGANRPIQFQMVENPPIRDDLDIQRSGVHAYQTTVDCFVDDQAGKAPTKWMSLIADWMIGSQYTINGTINSLGIQSPICEGDNTEFDNVVYHIESVTHNASIDANGDKTFRTILQVTNGMRADGETDVFTDSDDNKFPIYPGMIASDNRFYGPGLVMDGQRSVGGESKQDKSKDEDAWLGTDEAILRQAQKQTEAVSRESYMDPYGIGLDAAEE